MSSCSYLQNHLAEGRYNVGRIPRFLITDLKIPLSVKEYLNYLCRNDWNQRTPPSESPLPNERVVTWRSMLTTALFTFTSSTPYIGLCYVLPWLHHGSLTQLAYVSSDSVLPTSENCLEVSEVLCVDEYTFENTC